MYFIFSINLCMFTYTDLLKNPYKQTFKEEKQGEGKVRDIYIMDDLLFFFLIICCIKNMTQFALFINSSEKKSATPVVEY